MPALTPPIFTTIKPYKCLSPGSKNVMKNSNNKFWIRSISLTALIILCILYMAITFVMQYSSGSFNNNSTTILDYAFPVIHLCTLGICFFYLYDKVSGWAKIDAG